MSTELHPLDFEARQAAKAASREADFEALRDGSKSGEQIKAENELLALPHERIRIRLDDAVRLA